MLALAMPIPPEKYSTWRTAIDSFSGPRRAEYDARNKRMGVERQGVWLQQTPQGPMEILVVETADPERFFALLATSQDPFDVEFRAFLLDVYGLDLTKPLPAPLPERLIDWSATRPTAAV
jgi:hypothetical protein